MSTGHAMRELDREECMRLPAQAPVGRIVHTHQALPAFETDQVDAATGWSVVVTGHASVVTDPAEHERLTRTGPRLPALRGVFVRIESDLVTGRTLYGVRLAS
jgi:hypothetical protein